MLDVFFMIGFVPVYLISGWDYGALLHFRQYFSYIAVVSFIGGGNGSSRRKPLACRNSQTNFFT